MANDRAGSFLLGLSIGSAIGGALAFLLAPRPGDEMRADLKTTGVEIKERASTIAEQAKDMGLAAVDEQRSRLRQAVTEGREAADRTRADLLNRYERAKKPE
jgi:gas vesicle protein